LLGAGAQPAADAAGDAGDLAGYLRPPTSTGGAHLLELAPRGLPPLREHVARLIRPQANNCERYRRPRIDHRWALVAGAVSEALADCGGLALCDAEAQAAATAMPAAVAAAFGDEGLEMLRVALIELGCWRAGSAAPPDPAAEGRWWREYGRWEPDGERLEDDDFWANVAPIAGGFAGGPFVAMTGSQARELHHQLQGAIESVEAGARWDQVAWDTGNARTLLDDSEVAAGECSSSRLELERLAAGGLLPPDLQAAADAALERYRANDQQAAAE
jgi:hypothetical protein